jgi:hypothetical protein
MSMYYSWVKCAKPRWLGSQNRSQEVAGSNHCRRGSTRGPPPHPENLILEGIFGEFFKSIFPSSKRCLMLQLQQPLSGGSLEMAANVKGWSEAHQPRRRKSFVFATEVGCPEITTFMRTYLIHGYDHKLSHQIKNATHSPFHWRYREINAYLGFRYMTSPWEYCSL